MNEKQLQQTIVTTVRRMRGVVFNFVGSRYMIPGIPDLFISHKIWVGWIEVKGPKTPLSADQVIILRKLRENCSAFVVRPGKIYDETSKELGQFETIPELLNTLRDLS